MSETGASPISLALSRKLNGRIDMGDKRPLQDSKSSKFRSERKAVDGAAAAQLAEEELHHVVGGYIGETEKNRS